MAESQKRQARGEKRRQAIIDAAVELFSRTGFRSTGIIPLAERVGITHATLLHYFGTKENLLRAVVDERRRDEEVTEAWFEANLGIAVFRDLPVVAEALIADPTFPRLYSVLVAENYEPTDPLNGFFVKRYDRVRQLLARSVHQGIEAGDIAPQVDPEGLAREVLGTVLGLQQQWLIDRDDAALRAAYASYSAALLERISA